MNKLEQLKKILTAVADFFTRSLPPPKSLTKVKRKKQ